MSSPWCENCQAEVDAETNESNGFTCVYSRIVRPRQLIISLLALVVSPLPHPLLFFLTVFGTGRAFFIFLF